MSWVAAGIAAAGAVKGGLDAEHARKQQRKHDAFRREAIAMSPWTGMGDPGAGNFGNTDTFSGMLGGGMQGAMLGTMVGGAGAWGGGASKAAAGGAGTTAMNTKTGANALGGADMAAQLGAQGQQAMAGMKMPAPTSAPIASAGAMGTSPWAGMSSQGVNHLQMPTLGGDMKGLYAQTKGLNPYSTQNMFGMGGI